MRKVCFSLSLLFSLAIAFTGSAWSIQTPVAPTPAEQTAREELEHYLAAAVSGTLTVVGNDEVVFHLGDSDFSRHLGIDAATLKDEEWIIRSEEGNVALLGGGERGTLYAVYHFLEDEIGVRWWGPDEESIPGMVNCELPLLARSGRPFFRQREIYRHWSNLKPDQGRFAARRRLNRDGEAGIAPTYGGELAYGGPYFVHTFHMYLPEERYFAEHPEYYALINGKRTPGPLSQLCLSNQEMRQELYRQLEKTILAEEAEAAAAGKSAPVIYSLSMNDCKSPCQCAACHAIVEREESGAGPLLVCVNELAAQLREFRPGLLLSTLAYYDTEVVPKHLRPADNVLIVLCDTSTNQAQPVTAPENRKFRELVEGWAAVAPNLGIWDYSITYDVPSGPYPHEYAIAESMRFYAEHQVKYLFFEHEVAECADWYVPAVWLESRLMEDPTQSVDALLDDFMPGYFGAAAPHMTEYRQLLRQSCVPDGARIGWYATPAEFTHITWENAIRMQQLFDVAEQAVAEDPVLLRRVRRARLNLDRICALNYNRLANEFVRSGNPIREFPLQPLPLVERARETRLAEIDRLLEPSRSANSRNQAEVEYAALAGTVYVPHRPPSRFAEKSHLDFPGNTAQLYYGLTVASDPEAESGYVVSRKVEGAQPLPFGRYVHSRQTTLASGVIAPEQIPGAGYHWYNLGTFTPEADEYLYFFGDWAMQYLFGSLLREQETQPYEIWVSVKFSGADYPGGAPGEAHQISIERIVLVPVAATVE